VAGFCLEDINCRREYVLAHFHERFDRSDCNKGCDNCVAARTGTLRDLTQEAVHISKLVQELENNNLTRVQCVAIFQGRQIAVIRQRHWDQLRMYGKGSHLDSSLTERLIDNMLSKGILEEAGIRRDNGFTQDYLKVKLFFVILTSTYIICSLV
jgi:bloom syndrome protein